MRYSKVLLAVDNLKFARLAQPFVGNYHWPPNTVFRLIHVISPVRGIKPSTEKIEKAKHLLAKVTGLIREAAPAAKIEARVLVGNPRSIILSTAMRWQPELIVVGSGKRSAGLKGVLGSVSTAVACQSRCSVHIVKER